MSKYKKKKNLIISLITQEISLRVDIVRRDSLLFIEQVRRTEIIVMYTWKNIVAGKSVDGRFKGISRRAAAADRTNCRSGCLAFFACAHGAAARRVNRQNSVIWVSRETLHSGKQQRGRGKNRVYYIIVLDKSGSNRPRTVYCVQYGYNFFFLYDKHRTHAPTLYYYSKITRQYFYTIQEMK